MSTFLGPLHHKVTIFFFLFNYGETRLSANLPTKHSFSFVVPWSIFILAFVSITFMQQFLTAMSGRSGFWSKALPVRKAEDEPLATCQQ